MYTTCLYCQKPLGANEVIEMFPVGRRLAFDAAQGRLWVVCRQCERWNLTPLDTRWEAIEACERHFAGTRVRLSTDQIGLARLAEGLELVRIGAPQRPEFAAWRYGDQFGRRRRRAILIGGGAVVAIGAVVVGAAAAGVGVGGFGGLWSNIPNMIKGMRVVRLRTPDGRHLKIRGTALGRLRFRGDPATGEPFLSLKHGHRIEVFRGSEALAAAGTLLPAVNPAGGSKHAVAEAVRTIEAARGSEGFLDAYLAETRYAPDRQATVARSAVPTRLALEMALHEEAERKALAGELRLLEAAWREAEELAQIADHLLVPPEVEQQLEELKHRTT